MSESAPPSIGALDSRVYVRLGPRASSPEIGVLHLGAVVPLRSPDPVSTDGCARGWYAVEPEGFVCLDETTTTLDVEHPLIRAKRRHHGDFSSPTPFRFSESREALLYRKLPSPEEQRRAEFELDKHLRHVGVEPATAKAPGFLSAGALSPWSLTHAPEDKRPRAKWVPTRSAIAWTDEFFAEGRNWVLTEDLLIAPKDKLIELSASSFRGVMIDGDRARLPMAFIRREPRPKFHLAETAPDMIPVAYFPEEDLEVSAESDDRDPLQGFHEDESPGTLVETGEPFERLAALGLTGRYRKQHGVRYLETTEHGTYVRERDATLVGAELPRGFELADGEKWIDISIFRGTLVAYEGNRPVFATLISPGANGYKRENGERAKYTTPTGTFRIEWKHRSTTMTPDPKRMSYYLSEVPYTQFFHMPFALHAAYWHDRFGEPRSGGCVNLSPSDAEWLFRWTTPSVPDGWHAVRSGEPKSPIDAPSDRPRRSPGTWVRIR